MNNLNRKKGNRKLVILGIVLLLVVSTISPVFAAGANFGQNAGQWIMDQAFWLALAVIAVVGIGFIVKRAWVAFLVFAVIAAIALAIIKNPQMLQSIGDSLLQVVTQ